MQAGVKKTVTGGAFVFGIPRQPVVEVAIVDPRLCYFYHQKMIVEHAPATGKNYSHQAKKHCHPHNQLQWVAIPVVYYQSFYGSHIESKSQSPASVLRLVM